MSNFPSSPKGKNSYAIWFMKDRFFVDSIYTRAGRIVAFDSSLCVLNLGCGSQRYPNVTGMDCLSDSAADIVHDLNVVPWPLADGSVDVVLALHVLEHLDNLPQIMEEIYRVAKHKTRIIIEVPYFRSVGAFQDPTHKHFFTTRTMDYFCANRSRDTYRYTNADFRLMNFWLGWPASRTFATRCFKKFVRAHPDFYDKHLSLLLPVPILVFELEARKS